MSAPPRVERLKSIQILQNAIHPIQTKEFGRERYLNLQIVSGRQTIADSGRAVLRLILKRMEI